MTPERLRLRAGDVDVAALAWGSDPDAPLALCLHGYPDTAWTWRHLGPALAARGWRVVAPWMRGYAPTGLAPDGGYQVGALVRDAVELHRALGGDERAVLIGHDWGAVTAYAAASFAPERWARVVTMAVAPPPVLLGALRRPALAARQLRMSWYMAFQQLPGVSERVLPRLIPRLWRDWSPGYDAREDLKLALAAVGTREHATAALRYYRAFFQPWTHRPEYAAEQAHLLRMPPQPLVYLHGERDGCQLPDIARGAERVLRPPSRFELVPGAGHFLHLERPDHVNALIAEFVGDG